MAKQRDAHNGPESDDPKAKSKSSQDAHDSSAEEAAEEVLSADDLEVVEEAEPSSEGGSPKKAAKEPAEPTKIGRAAEPTQLAKKSPQPTMLQPEHEKKSGDADDDNVIEVQAEESSKPPTKRPPSGVPDLSLDDADEATEVVEIKEQHVVEEDVFADEVVEAEAASDAGQKTPTPATAGHKEVAEPRGPSSADAENLDFVTSADLGMADQEVSSGEKTELLDGSALPLDAEEPTELSHKALKGHVDFEASDEDVLAPESSIDVGKERKSGGDALAESIESDVDLDLSTESKIMKSDDHDGEGVDVGTVEEGEKEAEDEADIFSDTGDKAAVVAEGEADELADEEVTEQAEEEEVVGAGKGAKAAVADEEEDEEVGDRKSGVTPKESKPRYLRHWIAAGALTLVLLLAVFGGLWFASPGVLEGVLESLPGSPYKKTKDDYQQAKSALADMSRAKDAEKAKADELAQNAAKNEKELNQKIAGLKSSEQAATQVRDALVKAEVVPPTTDIKELPKAVGEVVEAKQKAESLVSGIGKTLENAKIIEKDKLDPESLEKAVKDLSASKAALGAVNKKLEAAKTKQSGVKGIDELIAARKEAEDKLDAIDKALGDAKVKGGAEGVEELAAARKKLETERNELDSAINQAYKELAGATALPPGSDLKKAVVSAIKALRQKSDSPLVAPLSHLVSALSGLGVGTGRLVERGFDTATLLAEVGYYRLREPLVQTPAKQLDSWITLLQNPQAKDTAAAANADKEAAWLLNPDAKSSPELKAKARYVTALALRNKGKYAEARAALAQVVKDSAGFTNAPWMKAAAQSYKDLTDPDAYYLPRARNFEEQGSFQNALIALNAGLQAIPDDGRLLARRALLRLEMARPRPTVEARQEIRRDAEAATKDPRAAADGYFALGQLEEAVEHWSEAENDYRQALKASNGPAEQADRYRIALARLLLLHEGVPAAVPPQPPAKEEKKPAPPAKDDTKVGRLGLNAIFCLTLTCLQLPAEKDETPQATGRVKESIDLANELIKSANPKTKGHGYMLLGQAYARQGRRTEGLKLYVKGLDLVYPGSPAKDLERMVQEHPAFQHPDALARPNAFFAERQFGQGLHQYWAGDHAKAEEYFNSAVGFFNQDARYFYFLGLARLHQKGKLKRDAGVFALEQGARLEADNHPPAAEVNMALERVQGDLRRYVDQFRQKALLPGS